MVATCIHVYMVHFCFVVCSSPHTPVFVALFLWASEFSELFIVSALMFLSYSFMTPQWLSDKKDSLGNESARTI